MECSCVIVSSVHSPVVEVVQRGQSRSGFSEVDVLLEVSCDLLLEVFSHAEEEVVHVQDHDADDLRTGPHDEARRLEGKHFPSKTQQHLFECNKPRSCRVVGAVDALVQLQ